MSEKQSVKRMFREALDRNDIQSIVVLARTDRGVLSQLIRLAYDRETLMGWRAIKAIGQVARELVKTDHEMLRETIRKQLWMLNDESGGIGWSAPEILGEIVSSDPVRFRDFVPLIVEAYDFEETIFRPGVLYALALVAEKDPAAAGPYKNLAMRALGDENPLVRVHCLELVNNMWTEFDEQEKHSMRKHIENLKLDRAEVWIYKRDGFINIQIKEEANRLLSLISG